jgi:hypothetical protein
LKLIEIKTTEKCLMAPPRNLQVEGTWNSRSSQRVTLRSSIHDGRREYWQLRLLIFLLPLGAIAPIVYPLQDVPGAMHRLELEDYGVAFCAVPCCGRLPGRAIGSFLIERNVREPAPFVNSTPVQTSEPNLAEPRKIQSSLPPEAATASAAPVASTSLKARA